MELCWSLKRIVLLEWHECNAASVQLLRLEQEGGRSNLEWEQCQGTFLAMQLCHRKKYPVDITSAKPKWRTELEKGKRQVWRNISLGSARTIVKIRSWPIRRHCSFWAIFLQENTIFPEKERMIMSARLKKQSGMQAKQQQQTRTLQATAKDHFVIISSILFCLFVPIHREFWFDTRVLRKITSLHTSW